MAGFLDLFTAIPAPQTEPIFGTLYGGVITGFGMGLVFLSGSPPEDGYHRPAGEAAEAGYANWADFPVSGCDGGSAHRHRVS